MRNIGFIGLGHMGLPMAINLVKAGYIVSGYDLQPKALEIFSQAGGVACENLENPAIQDAWITMLQTGAQVQSVCLGDKGLFKKMQPGTLYIDCSSITVPHARKIHQEALACALEALDAPVSGGVAGAKAGSLTFMVGGEKTILEKAQPVLKAMGQNIIHTGGPGSGQAAKICNNMILGISMVAISEAFCLAKKLGLEDKKLFEVVNNASGQCWTMSKYVPVPGILEQVPANNQYQPGFTAHMMLKDLNTSQEAAETTGLNTPIAAAVTELYQEFVDQGLGDLDFSGIIRMIGREK